VYLVKHKNEFTFRFKINRELVNKAKPFVLVVQTPFKRTTLYHMSGTFLKNMWLSVCLSVCRYIIGPVIVNDLQSARHDRSVFGQCMSIRHNLLYKTWADWPGVYIAALYLKEKVSRKRRKEGRNTNKNKNNVYKKQLKMYVSLDTDKDCDLLRDRPVFSTGSKPHHK